MGFTSYDLGVIQSKNFNIPILIFLEETKYYNSRLRNSIAIIHLSTTE